MASKLKRFASSNATTKQIAESLTHSEADESGYDTIPLERIQLDPENPRHLGLEVSNPRLVAQDDARREEKLAYIEKLEDLALSIASQGVITPIRVYRIGREFRIAHGERRYLASVMAGEVSIPAIILKEKPKTLRLQQLLENFQREDLSAFRRCENIRSVLIEAAALGEPIDSHEKLRKATGIGRSQAFDYLAVACATDDVWDALASGQITSVGAAAVISRISDPAVRARAIQEGIDPQGNTQPTPVKTVRPKGGRPAAFRFPGATTNADVARRIIEAVGGAGRYEVDWTNAVAVSKTFKQLLKDLEGGVL